MNFFSYESKPMQILMQLADLLILNFLYILCCIPIFTIGAAQAGLYSGVKALQDPDDDTYCSAAFFKGFRSGFGKVTLAWNALFIVEILMALVAVWCVYYEQSTNSLPFWAAIVALCIVALFHSLVPIFHARFNCTAWQLIRNTWFLAIAHPLRSLAVGVLTWLPMILFVTINFVDFMGLALLWLLIYYAGAFLFNFTIMKKPFQILIDHFNETHGQQTVPAEEEETAEQLN